MPSASVPIVPLHRPEDMVLAIERLRERAEADGNGTLAYLLLMAEAEAKNLSEQLRRDQADHEADPGDLWTAGGR